MKKLLSENITVQLLFLSTIVFLSRIPFLWAGFGAEEDSWLLALTAKNTATSGVYEMSRAPAHPLQELIYALMYHNGLPARSAGGFAFWTNLLSAVSSVLATMFFALSLKQMGFKYYLFASFAFAFTPVIFISSTYTIDYMLAMSFVMMSFYFLLKSNLWLAGILLGLAIGCRTTATAMLIPFCFLLFPVSKNFKGILILVLSTALVGFITYLPVIKTYGISFITTYFDMADRFSSPPPAKIFYKATMGVFGCIGVLALLFFSFRIVTNRWANLTILNREKRILSACALTILFYILIYIRVPHKSAFLIPLVPFLILSFGYFLSDRQFKLFCILLTMSSFLFSINLTDSLRGSAHSTLSVKFTIANQEIFIDPLTGPVFSDYTKRQNKIAFTEKVFQKTQNEKKKVILICGWWYNELRVRNWNCKQNQNVVLTFYIDKTAMFDYISDGYEIFYLPEQNLYNDQYSRMKFTDSAAKPYM